MTNDERVAAALVTWNAYQRELAFARAALDTLGLQLAAAEQTFGIAAANEERAAAAYKAAVERRERERSGT